MALISFCPGRRLLLWYSALQPHELWALSDRYTIARAESGLRYTPTTTFETYPFPWPPGQEASDDPRVQAIAAAAAELVRLRDAWLNPPGLSEAELKKRTLTNLYNQRPTWLAARPPHSSMGPSLPPTAGPPA